MRRPSRNDIANKNKHLSFAIDRSEDGTRVAPISAPRQDGADTNGSETVQMTTAITRTEHDLLGNREVPADAYYGIHTLRAVENFPVTGTPISHYPELIRALAQIKMAAARANRELGLLNGTRADAIVEACRELEDRKSTRLNSSHRT